MKIATHPGNFHQDDFFAVALLTLIYPNAEIIRTRDPKELENADILVDVGGEYDPENNKFDHHQQGGAGNRENGTPYAALGLVWDKFGLEVCDGNEKVFDLVSKKFIEPIDAADNGVDIFKTNSHIFPYLFSDVLKVLQPTHHDNYDMDNVFRDMLSFGALIIKREVEKAKYFFKDIELVKESYNSASDKKIIVLDGPYPWKSIISQKNEPLFVVHPDNNTGEWVVACVPLNPKKFEYRKLLPQAWAGKKLEELKQITGVADAEFCHDKRFIAKAWSKEGAIKLANIAINQ